MNSDSTLGGALVVVFILVVIFLICREIVCWYWKLNQLVQLLTDIRDLMVARNNEERSRGPAALDISAAK